MTLKKLTYALLFVGAMSATTTIACTRILRADHEPAVVVGRNMDWEQVDRIPANLWVYPRGMDRNGFSFDNNPLRWRSKYGSIAATSFDKIKPVTSDGMNEMGLAVHLNVLEKTDYGTRNLTIPGLNILMLAQYCLDNFKTVDEVVRFAATNAFQVVPMRDPRTGRVAKLHLGIEDATGDSAIFEFVEGQLHIYHDRSYTALTNDPTYDAQLANLKLYQGFGGDKPLPGTTKPEDRFVRASYYAAHLPEYTTARDEVIGMFGVIENVTQPAGIVSPERHSQSETVWRVVSDLTNRVYYFSHMKGHNLIYASLDQFDLREGMKPKRLIVQEREDLSGNVATLFEEVDLRSS